MRIESINAMNTGMQSGMAQGKDAMSKNIQNQIRSKQQELQRISENEDMSLEEKMKKRQQIQQEIADLNTQLRQHQIEQRKEQRNRDSSGDDVFGEKQSTALRSKNGWNAGLSQAVMTSMISADSAMKQAQVQGNTAEQMKDREGVLKAEIKQDGARGGDTKRKEEELAETEKKAVQAVSAQMNTLSDAGKAVEEAAEAEREHNRTEDINEIDEKQKKAADVSAENIPESIQDTYAHVDVRL